MRGGRYSVMGMGSLIIDCRSDPLELASMANGLGPLVKRIPVANRLAGDTGSLEGTLVLQLSGLDFD